MSAKQLCILFLSIIFWVTEATAQQTELQVGFWNVENLFDTTDAVLIRDDDFTPSGKYEWTEERLVKKFNDLSRVIREMGRNGDLAILGLAEIENLDVLTRFNDDFLKTGMEILHKESPDERGIDCALLFNTDQVVLVNQHFHTVYLAGDEKTRDIIEAQFQINSNQGSPSLYVFINHWPSRWGGQEVTDPLRRAAARRVRNRIDNILISDPGADIMILGDFNDYPSDPSLQSVLRAVKAGPDLLPGDLINTTWGLHVNPEAGTIKYRGKWTVLDQIIISQGMRDNKNWEWVFESTQTFMPDYLIESEGKYSGWPYRMYRSGKYHGGYSDHLPILSKVTFSE